MSGPGTEVRLLMRSAVTAALGTTLVENHGGSEPGRAYTSLVLSACGWDGSPLLLLSDLALHAANIAADPRVALLFDGTLGLSDRLTGMRASVLGRAEKWTEEPALGRFLARHPSAAGYAGFGDFALYRVALERAHVVAGFGAIQWVDGAEIIAPGGSDTAAQEAEVVARMNTDHGDGVAAMGARLGTAATPMAAASTMAANEGDGDTDWQMIGVDRDGCDLRHDTRLVRANFAAPLDAAADVAAATAALAERALA